MRVTVNGGPDDVPGGTSVEVIVTGLGRGRAGIAVALNDEVIPRSQWSSVELAEGDRVEILTATQGG